MDAAKEVCRCDRLISSGLHGGIKIVTCCATDISASVFFSTSSLLHLQVNRQRTIYDETQKHGCRSGDGPLRRRSVGTDRLYLLCERFHGAVGCPLAAACIVPGRKVSRGGDLPRIHGQHVGAAPSGTGSPSAGGRLRGDALRFQCSRTERRQV